MSHWRTMRISHEVREVLALAHEEARKLQHRYMGGEHLLLGLLREESSRTAQGLNAAGLQFEPVRALVADLIGVNGQRPLAKLTLSPTVKQVLTTALAVSPPAQVQPEHLLQALLAANDEVVNQILRQLGVGTRQIERKLALLNGAEGTAPPLLQRHPDNPILLPDPTSPWESSNVFNPSVIFHNGLFHMHYRAQGLDWVSRIGYAVSTDGVRWNRLRQPVLEPHDGSDSRGVEDPRVTEIDGRFYMCYTAYGRDFVGQPTHAGGGIRPMIARSDNLITWERLGPLVTGEDNKDHVLFPRKVNGRYLALHRRWPHIWLAASDDLHLWREEDMAPILGPRPDSAWEAKSVGANGVPIETEHGWLLLYHGYGEGHIYQFGACLLDLTDPRKVVKRPLAPIFWPQEMWELRGDVPNVVFSNANPVVDGTVYVYYGGADHVIGLATCPLNELLHYVLTHS